MSELPPLPYEAEPGPRPDRSYQPRDRPYVYYSEELAETILDRMISGESVVAICCDDGMPHIGTIMNWVANRKDFRERYRSAQEARACTHAEQILHIANTPLIGERTEEGSGPEGGFYKTIREDMLGHRKLQIDARKWLMARMAPKRYGDRITQEHVGKDGAALIPIITVNGTPTGG